MIETIEFNKKQYLKLQSVGNAMQFALPFAKQLIGEGKVVADIGVKDKSWSYPGSYPIDIDFNDGFDAMNLPPLIFDAIINSHFLEHYIGRYQEVVEYWLSKLRLGGLIFMYLPNCNFNDYWAYANTKHIHHMTPELMEGYCEYLSNEGWISKYFVTKGADLNASFYVIIEK